MAEDRLAGIKARLMRVGGCSLDEERWLITELEQARARGDERLCAEYTRGHAESAVSMRECAAKKADEFAALCTDDLEAQVGYETLAAAIRELPDG